MSESENGRAEALARIDVFADCTASDLVPLARLLRPLRAATGEVLMVQGEPADEFLIIAEGSVAITREPRDESDPPLTADAGRILANGGRVLNVTARGETLAQAHQRAYAMVDGIDWPGGFCRRDIGWRAL